MRNVRLKKSIVSVFAFLLLLSASGSGHGLVLCWGHDSHMHMEVTFNGVNCGHLLLSSATVNSRQHLTGASFAAAPCYSCTDIPLSFPRYLLKQYRYSTYPHNEKTAITIGALPVSYSPRIPQ